jgi:hypothetical protein
MDAVAPVDFGPALVECVNGLMNEGRIGMILGADVICTQHDVAVVLKAPGKLTVTAAALHLRVLHPASRALQMRKHKLDGWIAAGRQLNKECLP